MASKKVVLRFGKDISENPIIYHLAKDFDLVFNIIRANVNPNKEGTVVLELSGEQYEKGLEFLKSQGVRVQPLAENVIRNESKCTSCGACTDICPTGALYLERPSMAVGFNSDKCVVCAICLKVCPFKAMEIAG